MKKYFYLIAVAALLMGNMVAGSVPSAMAQSTVTLAVADTAAPSIPADLSASAVSPSQINLTWTASSDNVGATGYNIYRDSSLVGASVTTSFNNTGLAPSTTYSYTVAAFDAAGNISDRSGAVSTKTGAIRSRNYPPSIVGITAPTILKIGQTGVWTVNASDRENSSLSYAVDWGDSGPGIRNLASPQYVQTAEFSHQYLAAGIYKVKFTVKDDVGQTNFTSVTTLVMEPSNGGLIINDLKVSDITDNQAIISWETSQPADSAAWLAIASPVETAGAPASQSPDMVKDHKLILTRLAPATIYYLIVGSSDGNNKAMSKEISFMTKELVNKPPAIARIDGPSALTVDQTGVWTITASDPENDTLSYMVVWGDENISVNSLAREQFVQTAEFSHSYAAAGDYTIRFTVKDDSGQAVSDNVVVTVAAADTAAPSIPADLSASAVSPSQINLTWTASSDNVGATGYNIYRDSSLVGASVTTSFNNTGLAPSTTYSYTVAAFDAAGNISAQSTAVSATTMAMTMTMVANKNNRGGNEGELEQPDKNKNDENENDENNESDESDEIESYKSMASGAGSSLNLGQQRHQEKQYQPRQQQKNQLKKWARINNQSQARVRNNND